MSGISTIGPAGGISAPAAGAPKAAGGDTTSSVTGADGSTTTTVTGPNGAVLFVSTTPADAGAAGKGAGAPGSTGLLDISA